MGGVILATFLLGATNLWIHHQRVLSRSRNTLTAQFVLKGEMETVIARGFHQVDELVAEPAKTFTLKRKFRGVEQQYDFVSDITMLENTEGSLRKAIVEVRYTDQVSQSQKTLSMETDLFWSE